MGKKSSGSLIFSGLMQALGVTAYCSLVGILFWKGNEIFGKVPNYFGPVTFLLLLSVSVLTCGFLFFFRPYNLFFAHKKKEAIDLVLSTAGWLFVFFLIFLTIATGGFLGKK